MNLKTNFNIIIIVLIFFNLLLAFIPCCLANTEMLTYKNKEYGYSIDYPRDWDNYFYYGDMMFKDLVNNSNVYISVEEYSEDMELAEFLSIANEGFEELVSNYNLVDEYYSTIDNVSCYVRRYTGYYESETFVSQTVEQKQIAFIKQGSGYVISCTALPDEYEDVDENIFNPMIQSFKFIDTNENKSNDSYFMPIIFIILSIMIVGIIIFVIYRIKNKKV